MVTNFLKFFFFFLFFLHGVHLQQSSDLLYLELHPLSDTTWATTCRFSWRLLQARPSLLMWSLETRWATWRQRFMIRRASLLISSVLSLPVSSLRMIAPSLITAFRRRARFISYFGWNDDFFLSHIHQKNWIKLSCN